jgi:BT1 family
MTPTLTSTYNFYYTVELKFDLATMSNLGFVTAIGYFISILVLNFVFTEVDFKRFYLITGAVIMLINFSNLFLLLNFLKQLNVSNVVFVYLMNGVLVFANELNFLPLLGLCVRLCPKDLEGTTYGILTSLFNLGYYLASILASLLLILFEVSSKR